MYTMGERKYDEMTPYVNITILFMKFSVLIRECLEVGQQPDGPAPGVPSEKQRLY
jgi:hypothetical protein